GAGRVPVRVAPVDEPGEGGVDVRERAGDVHGGGAVGGAVDEGQPGGGGERERAVHDVEGELDRVGAGVDVADADCVPVSCREGEVGVLVDRLSRGDGVHRRFVDVGDRDRELL